MSDGWQVLEDEYAAWADSGAVMEFWWRDDDATRPTDPLERLIRLSGDYGVPVVEAVIPNPAEAELAERLGECDHFRVAQHGFRHDNHEPGDDKSSEYGPSRGEAEMIDEIRAGWSRLDGFANRVPVFVPP